MIVDGEVVKELLPKSLDELAAIVKATNVEKSRIRRRSLQWLEENGEIVENRGTFRPLLLTVASRLVP